MPNKRFGGVSDSNKLFNRHISEHYFKSPVVALNNEFSSFKEQSKGGQPGDRQVFMANSPP